MVKIRTNVRLYDRYYWIDEQSCTIRWEPSKKDDAHIPISSILEVRWGQATESFKSADPDNTLIGKSDASRDYVQEERRCFSIIYFKNQGEKSLPMTLDTETLDLMTDSIKLTESWVIGLKLLLITKHEQNPIQKCNDLLHSVDEMRSKWLSQVFHQCLQENRKTQPVLTFQEAVNLLISILQHIPRGYAIKTLIQVEASSRGDSIERRSSNNSNPPNDVLINSNVFTNAYKSLASNKDFLMLCIEYSSANIPGSSAFPATLDAGDLQYFLEAEQHIQNLTIEECQKIIYALEPIPDLFKQGLIGIDGMSRLLRSANLSCLLNPFHSNPNAVDNPNPHRDVDITLEDQDLPFIAYPLRQALDSCSATGLNDLPGFYSRNSTSDAPPRSFIGSKLEKSLSVQSNSSGCTGLPNPPDSNPSIQPMHLPLDSYLINASYQTYLTQDMVDPICSLDSYRAVLARGARFIHLDVYPVFEIHDQSFNDYCLHQSSIPDQNNNRNLFVLTDLEIRYTTTEVGKGIKLTNLLDVLKKFAFSCNQFPLIIWCQVHEITKNFSVGQSKVTVSGVDLSQFSAKNISSWNLEIYNTIATLFNKSLGSALVSKTELENACDGGPLLSPIVLQNRFLLSTMIRDDTNIQTFQKSSFFSLISLHLRSLKELTINLGTFQSTQEGLLSNQENNPERKKLSAAKIDLVYSDNEKILSMLEENMPDHDILVFTEEEAAHLISRRILPQFSEKYMTMVIPSFSRTDCSNINPQAFWQRGVQLVCMNHQTAGLMMDLNEAKFLENRACGFNLRPWAWNSCSVGLKGHVLNLDVICGVGLSKPNQSSKMFSKAYGIDPYVIVEMYGPGCGIPHFLDANTSNVKKWTSIQGGGPQNRTGNKNLDVPILSGDLIGSIAYCEQRRTITAKDCGAASFQLTNEIESALGSGTANFQHSIEFDVDHPESSILRFVVLDDEPITQ